MNKEMYCFKCQCNVLVKQVEQKLVCPLCGVMLSLKSTDPPGHPDDWGFIEEEL